LLALILIFDVASICNICKSKNVVAWEHSG
jgi:hypothetical protein